MIDTHCHITCDNDVIKIKEFLKENIAIVMGTTIEDNEKNIELCQKYNNLYFCLGIHPSNALENTSELEKLILENVDNEKFVGIGEIGIDLYWRKDNLSEQITLFEKQVKLAKKYNKTIVIHSRESINEIFETLKKMNIGDHPLILHCYNGDQLFYEKFKNSFNVKFGIGGAVTYKNDRGLRDFVKNIKINDLLLETDSPYLSPEPFRGKENSSNNLIIIAKKIAEVREKESLEIVSQTTNNAISQFDLKL